MTKQSELMKSKTKVNSFFSKFSIIFLLFISLASCSKIEKQAQQTKKPNIILIVADDLGYADIGCFGGDIETPNIDALASNGIRFSSFHTAPMCAPTRAMILSGNDNHIAGMGAQGRVTNEFGYEGMLSNRIIPIPSLLKKAGYHTYMAGKWHLGSTPEANPNTKGFEHSFVLLGGAGNHYTNESAFRKGNSNYTEDGKPTKWPEGEYSTNFYTDKIIEFIDNDRADGKPFFAFAAYTSPHWPLQVDEKHWGKYKGIYDDGYDELKERRLESLKKAGLIKDDALLPVNHEGIQPWDSLSATDKLKEARKMELYAGMVDNLDYNIGRLIKHLKDIGEFENTLIVFMSDNGAAHRDFYYAEGFEDLAEYYTNDYENMGNYNSYVSYGPQWAEAGSAPFRYYKDYATQGGINTPLILSGSGIDRLGETHHGLATLMDLAPTFYELAEISYPKTFNDHELSPLKGTSLLPFTSGKTNVIHTSDYVFGLEHYGNAMIRKGDWKITNFEKPFKIENFNLYNLSKDIAEQNDLKNMEPEKFTELLEEWKKFSAEIKVQFPTPKAD